MFNAFGCFFFSCLPATRVSQNVRFRPEAQPRDVCWRPLQSQKTASALCFRGKNKQTQNEFAQRVIEHSCSKRQERRVSCCPHNIHPGPHIPRLCLMWSFSASLLYFLRIAGVPFSPHGGLLLVIRAAESAEILTAVDRRALRGTQRLLAYHSVYSP